jgi:hypothetical protein
MTEAGSELPRPASSARRPICPGALMGVHDSELLLRIQHSIDWAVLLLFSELEGTAGEQRRHSWAHLGQSLSVRTKRARDSGCIAILGLAGAAPVIAMR